MSSFDLDTVLTQFQSGTLTLEEAKTRLTGIQDLGFARLDADRERRKGFPEVIFGAGKTPEQLKSIFASLMERSSVALATRVSQEKADLVRKCYPEIQYQQTAGVLYWMRETIRSSDEEGFVALISAGTSDAPIAEEAALTLQCMGRKVEHFFDVGISGIHRLFHVLPRLRKANAVIVVAGMDGALPAVVGGLLRNPVIAVPTSVGYGAGAGGITPLLTMLNSCAPGVCVMNIDNGFGAGYFAALIPPPR